MRTNERRVIDPQMNQTLHWKQMVSNTMKYTECDAPDTDMHTESCISTHTNKQMQISVLSLKASRALGACRRFVIG